MTGDRRHGTGDLHDRDGQRAGNTGPCGLRGDRYRNWLRQASVALILRRNRVSLPHAFPDTSLQRSLGFMVFGIIDVLRWQGPPFAATAQGMTIFGAFGLVSMWLGGVWLFVLAVLYPTHHPAQQRRPWLLLFRGLVWAVTCASFSMGVRYQIWVAGVGYLSTVGSHGLALVWLRFGFGAAVELSSVDSHLTVRVCGAVPDLCTQNVGPYSLEVKEPPCWHCQPAFPWRAWTWADCRRLTRILW